MKLMGDPSPNMIVYNMKAPPQKILYVMFNEPFYDS